MAIRIEKIEEIYRGAQALTQYNVIEEDEYVTEHYGPFLVNGHGHTIEILKRHYIDRRRY
jgi:hypothetical protein